MRRPRLFDLRTSRLPEAIGRCATNIGELCGIVNQAQEELSFDPMQPDEGWWGTWAQYAFTVSYPSATIIAPSEVARIIVMDVCKQPMRIRNQFYEFLEFSKGYQPTGCNTAGCGQQKQAYERETVATLHDFIGDKTVRAYLGDARDVGKRVLVQGKDANGKVVWSTSTLTQKPVQGETLVLASPFTDSVNTFSVVTGIQKDPTYGDVTLMQVDPTTLAETELTLLDPNEQTAQYRKYFINGLNRTCCGSTTQQLLALCKLDFIPVQSDSDYLYIPNIPALIQQCMAVRYSAMDTPTAAQLAQTSHAKALQLLNGQLDHYLGKEKVALRRSLFGSDSLRMQPI